VAEAVADITAQLESGLSLADAEADEALTPLQQLLKLCGQEVCRCNSSSLQCCGAERTLDVAVSRTAATQ
jgi:hypothetical protein